MTLCACCRSYPYVEHHHFIAVHAAVIAINEALEAGNTEATMQALRNPNACLSTVEEGIDTEYQDRLLNAKRAKAQAAAIKVSVCMLRFWHNKA